MRDFHLRFCLDRGWYNGLADLLETKDDILLQVPVTGGAYVLGASTTMLTYPWGNSPIFYIVRQPISVSVFFSTRLTFCTRSKITMTISGRDINMVPRSAPMWRGTPAKVLKTHKTSKPIWSSTFTWPSALSPPPIPNGQTAYAHAATRLPISVTATSRLLKPPRPRPNLARHDRVARRRVPRLRYQSGRCPRTLCGDGPGRVCDTRPTLSTEPL